MSRIVQVWIGDKDTMVRREDRQQGLEATMEQLPRAITVFYAPLVVGHDDFRPLRCRCSPLSNVPPLGCRKVERDHSWLKQRGPAH
jgi:hypothetical protein